jgi:hypothetical protein
MGFFKKPLQGPDGQWTTEQILTWLQRNIDNNKCIKNEAFNYIKTHPDRIFQILFNLCNQIEYPDSTFVSNICFKFSQSFVDNNNKIKLLIKENNDSKAIINTLEKKNKQLQVDNYLLNERFNQALSTSAAENVNRDEISVNDDRPEDYQTAMRYKVFCEQMLRDISDKIFSEKAKIDSSQKEKRITYIAEITSQLSSEIFMEAFSRLTSNSTSGDAMTFSSEQKNKLYPEICSPEMRKGIERLAKKGFELVEEILNSSPPGKLYTIEPEQPFNPEEHEVFQGCDQSGNIKFTVRPGLRTEKSVFIKPVVFTKVAKRYSK